MAQGTDWHVTAKQAAEGLGVTSEAPMKALILSVLPNARLTKIH